jgi:hypothetical protein
MRNGEPRAARLVLPVAGARKRAAARRVSPAPPASPRADDYFVLASAVGQLPLQPLGQCVHEAAVHVAGQAAWLTAAVSLRACGTIHSAPNKASAISLRVM